MSSNPKVYTPLADCCLLTLFFWKGLLK